MIGIIIINYKSDNETIDFVMNQLSKITINKKVIIVNNSSNKKSDLLLSERLSAFLVKKNNPINKCYETYILSADKNHGFAGGNNIGVKFLTTNFVIDYLLFTNNDIVITDNNIVDELIKKLSLKKDIGMIGPKIVDTLGNNQSPHKYISPIRKYFVSMFSLFIPLNQKYKFISDIVFDASEGYYYRIMGCFFLSPTHAFLESGMFDENTFLYSEECILSERYSLKNYKVYYLPSVSVLHRHSQTISKYYDKIARLKLLIKSDIYYYSNYKNYNIYLLKSITHLYILFNKIKFYIKSYK